MRAYIRHALGYEEARPCRRGAKNSASFVRAKVLEHMQAVKMTDLAVKGFTTHKLQVAEAARRIKAQPCVWPCFDKEDKRLRRAAGLK
mmetsp:Transcript_75360/g.200384  ORF Transcript_75360/g.200384 Transcript_75360/m.200384 type:complete len:88 (+) Transcript_75360:1038-1301(+)